MEDGSRQTIDDSLRRAPSGNFQRPGLFSSCNDFAFVAIDYGDVARIGNIHENSFTVFLQFKRFGMCAEFD